MNKRPKLTEGSFLAHIFGPKRNPIPTGIRKTTLTGIRGGRRKSRLAAFNRMSPVNQELLKQSGLRESYLKGESTLADAKRTLRPRGIQLGVAKPLRLKSTPITSVNVTRASLQRMLAQHIVRTVRAEGKHANTNNVSLNVATISNDPLINDALTWDYGTIKYAARKGSQYEVAEAHAIHNPFWYH